MASTSRVVVTLLLLLSLATCQMTAAEPTLTETIQQAFKEITASSDKLRVATQKITIFNAAQEGGTIAEGFAGIIGQVVQASAVLSGNTELGDDDAKLVVQSLTTFVQVHQALLNVVIGKHGLVTLIPFFEPIRVTLVELEAAVDSFAYSLIALIPTQKTEANKQFGSLSITITSAIQTYQGSIMGSGDPSPVESIQQAFKEITTLSDNLRVNTQTITIFNAGQKGVIIAQGLSEITDRVAKAYTFLTGNKIKELGDDDAKLVVQSLTQFVKVHQALLNVVIGKAGLLTLVPFLEPIRLSLVSLEAVVDSFGYALIDVIPTQKSEANKQFGSLSITISTAITVYSAPGSAQRLESAILSDH